MRNPGRSIGILALLLILAAPGFSQPYGNEWINFNQQYFKIKTAKDGIYRLTYDALAAAGFPTGSVDPRNLQLFHRGTEQSIIVSGELDARFDPGDYIEFFGTKNDGTLDQWLYRTPEAQPDPYYNLYSDTTACFLTWNLNNIHGKRISSFSENNTSGLPVESYYLVEKLVQFSSDYSPGLTYPLGNPQGQTHASIYDFGEGWTGTTIGKGSSTDFILDSLGPMYTSGPDPELNILINGRNNYPHIVEIFAGPGTATLRSLAVITFSYDSSFLFRGSLAWSDFDLSGKLTLRVKDNGANATDPDFISVSYIKLRYAHTPTVSLIDGGKIALKPNTTGKSYISFDVSGNPGRLWDITEADDPVNIGYNVTSSGINAIVPGTSSGANLILWGTNDPEPSIEKVYFRSFDPTQPNYLVISHKSLMKPSGIYSDPVRALAAYRASSQGGGFDTLVTDVGQLYNQFSYGEISPLAIKNFCSYFLDKGNPRYLLLAGKSIYAYFKYYRMPAGSLPFSDLVPTYGYPGSDALYTAGKKGTTYEESILTGRIPAKSPEEVAAYLNKLKESEAFPHNALWKKDLIHLSGGATVQELSTFKNYVNDFKSVAEDKYLGGQVLTLSRQTNNSIETINLSGEVNKGKLLITFFGHSAPSATDIDIGFVSDPGEGYDNKGKYPFILVNGCDAGEIFNTYLSFGEDWIVTPDRGAIGFIAHSGIGYPSQLKRYSDNFYATAFGDTAFIDKPIGAILRKTQQKYLSTYTPGDIEIAQVQQSILQGDPATPLFGAGKTDYAVDNNEVFISSLDGLPVTSQSDSFKISAIVKNFGIVDDSMYYAAVTRTLPDGTKISYDPVSFRPVYYSDTISFLIDNTRVNAFGLNQFDIVIDPVSRVRELSKLNNTAHFEYFLARSGTQNLLPFDFAIVSSDTAKLIFQATNPLSPVRNFTLQLDTIPFYNSPVQSGSNLSAKVVGNWPVYLPGKFAAKDTTVFFWRSRFSDLQPGEIDTWSGSSFCLIRNSPEGWAQASPYQVRQDLLTGLQFDSLSRQWKFVSSQTHLVVNTFGPDNPDNNYSNVTLSLNGQPYIYSTRLCTDNSINALAFDYASTQPYLVLKFGQYDILDRRSCGRQPQVINNLLDAEITGPEDYLTQYINSVKSGDYVLLFSIGTLSYQSWSSALKAKVSEIGVVTSTLDSLANGDPVIILGRKGSNPGTAIVIRANPSLGIPDSQQSVTLDHWISGSYTTAYIRSGIIGPARTWHGFTFNVRHRNIPDESWSFDINSVDQQGTENPYARNVTSSTNLSSLDATRYPYLELIFNTSNNISFTPAQLSNWLVTYDPMPEGILLPGDSLQVTGIKKQEGEKFTSGFKFKNLSDRDFSDSLRVDYTLANGDRHKSENAILKIPGPKAEKEAIFNVPINTLGLGGNNDLLVYANPKIIPEKYYNNNIITLPDHFTVSVDRTHPLIDVTVDGRYILDGDIVSPSPLISIRIKDENKILPKTTTDGISLKIRHDCDTCNYRLVSFSQKDVHWTPATAERDFSIDYNPKNLDDGFYTLSVQATDASGNLAGVQPYSIRFEVVNESQITNFYPYPNPFSSSTRFVFTLTGSDIPEQIKIQIMTISGRVVREIIQDEIGPIHIGNNITEYAWDGHDEFGDQLANGVYLYRVLVRMNGQTLPLRPTAGDKAFKQGFGKLYLLR